MEIRYPHVASIQKIYPVEYGCTCPLEVVLEDGKRAIAKYIKNIQGEIVPFNEYISYEISCMIGTPAPCGGIAVIDEQTQISKELKLNIVQYMGVCFYSEYIPKTVPISRRIASHVSNLDLVPRVVLFDEITRNTDRHEGNILVKMGKNLAEMYIIDNSHTFGDPEWDEHSFKLDDYESNLVWQANHDVYDLLVYSGANIDSDRLYQESDRIRSVITSDKVNEVFQSVPVSWIPIVGEKRLKHLEEYILNRVENLDRICGMICRERGV